MLCNIAWQTGNGQKSMLPNLLRLIFLHIVSKFQLNNIKNEGEDAKTRLVKNAFFCANLPFLAKTTKSSGNLAIFVFFYHPLHCHHCFSDFQHHLLSFDESMPQKF